MCTFGSKGSGNRQVLYSSKYANVTFSNNVGSRGAAIRLLGNGYLYFIGGAVVNFTNNRVQEFDGAIYASSGVRNSYYTQHIKESTTRIYQTQDF